MVKKKKKNTPKAFVPRQVLFQRLVFFIIKKKVPCGLSTVALKSHGSLHKPKLFCLEFLFYCLTSLFCRFGTSTLFCSSRGDYDGG